MNIIQIRKDARNEAIEKIAESLRKSIKLSPDELTFDFESILIATMDRFDCSRRCAVEYSKMALYRVGLSQADLKGKKDPHQKRLDINGKN